MGIELIVLGLIGSGFITGVLTGAGVRHAASFLQYRD
jgi:hypothetical protein